MSASTPLLNPVTVDSCNGQEHSPIAAIHSDQSKLSSDSDEPIPQENNLIEAIQLSQSESKPDSDGAAQSSNSKPSSDPEYHNQQNPKPIGSNRSSQSEVKSSDSDGKTKFSAVLTLVRLDRLPTFCASIRGQLANKTDDVQLESTIVGQPLFGSYNIVFPITFQDGFRWALKVPWWGTPTEINDYASSALRSEALTMRLIRRETSIPLPDVFAFESSLDNELGCPFILMSFMNGMSLYDCWFNKAISKEELHVRRTRTLKDLARAMAQLSRFSFDNGGSLIFDQDDNLSGIGPGRFFDRERQLNQAFGHEEANESALYFDAGPFSDPRAYYRVQIDRAGEPEDGIEKTLSMFVSWIPDLGSHCQKFVLAHPDYNHQNVLVSEDGQLQGLIDWDGAEAFPRLIGNEGYPSWLTRDWDPAMYAWNEDMERGIQGETLWEDSPETLARHRKEYESFMRSQLSLDQGQALATTETTRSPPSVTAASLFVDNLLTATGDPVCKDEIVMKFLAEILELIRDDPNFSTFIEPDSDTNDAGEVSLNPRSFAFDVFDVVESDQPDQQQIALLRKGFEALLGIS